MACEDGAEHRDAEDHGQLADRRRGAGGLALLVWRYRTQDGGRHGREEQRRAAPPP